MKKLIIILFAVFSIVHAQKFTVQSVKGKVMVQKGSSEVWTDVKSGDELSGNDVILTRKKSSIRLQKGEESFVLDADAAVNIAYLKKMSLNDLLLALAMEEINDLPKSENKTSNTAVYGEEQRTGAGYSNKDFEQLGEMKINGAKQLADKGYRETAVLAAKETLRKYPSTGRNFSDRLFLSDLLFSLNLYDECLSELNKMNGQFTNETEMKLVNKRLKKIKSILAK